MFRKGAVFLITLLLAGAVYNVFLSNKISAGKNEFKSNISDVSREKESFQTELWRAQQVIKSLNTALKQKEEIIRAELERGRVLTYALQKNERELNEAAGELRQVREDKESVESDLDVVLEAASRGGSSAKVSALKKKVTMLKRALKDSRREYARSQKELKRFKKSNISLVSSNNSLKLKIADSRPMKIRLINELKDVKDDLTRQTELLQQQQEELRDMGLLNKEIKDHARQLSELLVKKELLSDSREKELGAARDEIAGLNEKVLSLQDQLRQSNLEYERTAKLLNEINEISKKAGGQLEEVSEDKEDSGKQQAQELKRKVEVLLSP